MFRDQYAELSWVEKSDDKTASNYRKLNSDVIGNKSIGSYCKPTGFSTTLLRSLPPPPDVFTKAVPNIWPEGTMPME